VLRKGCHLAWVCLILLGGLLAWSITRLTLERRALEADLRAGCRRQAQDAARSVQAVLTSMQDLVHGIKVELEDGRLKPRSLDARLEQALAKAPGSASRVGVLFQPFAADPGRRLSGPYVERGEGRLRRFGYEGAGDYTRLPWYQFDLGQACWNEPHRDPGSGDLLVDYSEPVQLPGAASPSGVVRVEVTMKAIQELVGHLAPGSSGYGFLLSAKGVYLADPLDARVRNGVTFAAAARDMNEAGRLSLVPVVAAHRAGFAQSISAVSGQESWIFLEPVPAAGWSLGTMIIKDELNLAPANLKHNLVRLVTLAVGAGLVALYLLLRLWNPDGRKLWAFSAGGSLVIAGGIACLWHFAYTLHQAPRAHEVEVMSRASRNAFLKRIATQGQGFNVVSAAFIPTGVFIQQLELSGDSQMKVSGQVWQKFPKGLAAGERGVSFPEAVSSDISAGYAKQEGDTLVQVYPFRAVFRMENNTTVNYPFDKSSIRIRIWPRLLYSNTVLVPDLEAYKVLVPVTLPGIDQGLTLAGWQLGQSHFAFLLQSYNMNLGINSFTGQEDDPEMVYTFTLKRNFINPFIATFLPILVVVCLLFAVLVTTCRTRERAAATGYNVMNVLRTITSLFFPVVISQINLRNHILVEGLLYVEYYYFIIYLLILLVAGDALALAFWDSPLLQRDENRIAKLLFWPCTAASFYAVSILYLR
jgi:hypothetical protein